MSTPTTATPSVGSGHRIERLWPRRRPAVMAIVNCTPDSFSDGGLLPDASTAVRHAEALLAGGADLIDIGGESTRPGAEHVVADDERRRIEPVISELRRRHAEALISVDTSKTLVAAAALAAGADMVNDVTAGADAGMLDLVARSGAAIALMHMRGDPRTMQRDVGYRDVVREVADYLAQRAAAAVAAGIPRDRVWLDPGIGFGKDVAGNLALLAGLHHIAAVGHPVLVGPSRKSFIGHLTGAPVGDRLAGSLAALIPALSLERAVVRVHDARAAVQFLEVASRLRGRSA